MPSRNIVLFLTGIVVVSSLAIIFRPRNESRLEPPTPARAFGEGSYGDVVGIELGRTYSRIGVFRNNTFGIISDEFGRDVVPSYVAFPNYGPSLASQR